MRLVTSWLLSLALAVQPADLRRGVSEYVAAHDQQIVAELLELLAIPNVAADRANIRRNAEHLRELLTRHRVRAEILETTGNPLVYGALDVPGATRTVLFYCHYDGQPVDPSKWNQPDPFKPVIRGEGRDARIYARSAADDKAPIVALLAALDALESAGLRPSSNVRIILDGEEEASSPSLVPAIARHRDKLRADVMVILDGPSHSSGRPTLVYGARGVATLDLTVFGPRSGVHSGITAS
jgi:acetylornithine deacetylase/succinyl-diaminopimelate desuccinylase-like protein